MSATAAAQKRTVTPPSVFIAQGYADGFEGRPPQRTTKLYVESYRRGAQDWERGMEQELEEWRKTHCG